MDTTTQRARSLSCAETAKLIRVALAATFKPQYPTIKFYVRSSTYSGGSSISIKWTDGPTTAQVDAVTATYASRSFDGSIDLSAHNEHWLLPDGSITLATSTGTERSGGYLPVINNPRPHANAELVAFGSSHVLTERRYSADFLAPIAARLAREWGQPVPQIHSDSFGAWVDRDYSWTCNGIHTLGDLIQAEAQTTAAPVATPANGKPSAPAAGAETPSAPAAPAAGAEADTTPEITASGTWTWITFPATPTQATRDALSALGARWSAKRSRDGRSAWYLMELADSAELLAAIIATHVASPAAAGTDAPAALEPATPASDTAARALEQSSAPATPTWPAYYTAEHIARAERTQRIAAALTTLIGERWELGDAADQDRDYARISGPDGLSLAVDYTAEASKQRIYIKGRFFGLSQHRRLSEGEIKISVSRDRSDDEIAADIARRLLPDYRRSFAEAQTRKQIADARAAEAERVLAALEAATGQERYSHSPKLSASAGARHTDDARYFEAEVHDAGTISLKIDLPFGDLELAQHLLALVQAAQAGAGAAAGAAPAGPRVLPLAA